MQKIFFRVNFVPNKNIFSFIIGNDIWELSPKEYFNLEIKCPVNGDLIFNFNKTSISGNSIKTYVFKNINDKTKGGILDYIAKVKGSYQLSEGIEDGQQRYQ